MILNFLAGRNEWLDAFIIFNAEWLGWWLGVALVVFIAFGRDRKLELRMALEALGAGLISRFVITELIRFWYNRPRPFEVLENVYKLLEHSGGGAFPSGHAAFFFALATIVFLYHRRLGSLFFAFALLMSVSRVIAGIHWPSDILGGAVIGVLTSLLVNFIAKKYQA